MRFQWIESKTMSTVLRSAKCNDLQCHAQINHHHHTFILEIEGHQGYHHSATVTLPVSKEIPCSSSLRLIFKLRTINHKEETSKGKICTSSGCSISDVNVNTDFLCYQLLDVDTFCWQFFRLGGCWLGVFVFCRGLASWGVQSGTRQDQRRAREASRCTALFIGGLFTKSLRTTGRVARAIM